MLIRIIFIFLFIDMLLSDQILTRNIGQDVTFSCIVENDFQLNEVSFMHQTTGDILSLGLELIVDDSILNNHMKLIQFSTNRLDLKIYSVNQNDSGLYTCMLNDEKLSSFLLEIFIPPRFLSYSPLEANIIYPEGSSMNLSCHAFGIPSVNITWNYRDKNKQLRTIHNGEDIYISSVRSSDSGSYECIASNGIHASISRSFYVTVQYRPHIIMKTIIDSHDKYIQLLCEICSIPLSDIKWSKNKNIISNNIDFIIKNDQCLISIITIYELPNEKSDRYTCQAENILGHYSDHIDIQSNQTLSQIDSISNSSECFIQLSKNFFIFILILLNLLFVFF